MDFVSLIMSLLSGVAGGNLIGAAINEKDLGVLGNTIADLIGGGAGGPLVQMLETLNKSGVTEAMGHAASSGGPGMGSMLDIGSSGIGGAVLTVVVAFN